MLSLFTKRNYSIICAILFIVFILLLTHKIADPWQYRHDDNGRVYSEFARTHITQGLAKTRGQDFTFRQQGNEIEMRPYLHHPPLLALYLAGVFYLAGNDSPLIARSAMAFIHMLSFIMFFSILKVLFPKDYRMRLWAVLIFAIAPMSVFFGKMPDHESIGLLFIFCTLYGYLRYMNASRLRYIWLFFGAASWFLAGFTAWHAILVIAGLTVHAVYFRRQGASRFAAMSLICLVVVPLLVLIHLLWANNWQFVPHQKKSLIFWMASQPNRSYLVCLFDAFLYNGRYTGPLPTLYAVFWLFILLYRKVKGQLVSKLDLLVPSLAIGTVFYNLIFFNAVGTHPYQQFYLLPFIAIASALFVTNTYDKIALRHRHLAIFFAAASTLMTIILSFLYLFVIYSHHDPIL